MKQSQNDKPNRQLKFKLFPSKEGVRDYWKNFEVNIDSYCDKWNLHKEEFLKHFNSFSPQHVEMVAASYQVNAKNADIKNGFLTNVKACIDLYCVIKFSLKNPKALSNIFKIPIRKGNVDRNAVILKTLEIHRVKGLPKLYLAILAQRKGSGKFSYDINSGNISIAFETVNNYVKNLIGFMNRNSLEEYHLRFGSIINNDFYFLLLKETGDKILSALPDNTRVQTAKYILLRWELKSKKITIDTKDYAEAGKIRRYLSKKSRFVIKHNRRSATYNPKQFFDIILKDTGLPKQVKLVDASFRRNNLGDNYIKTGDNNHKNDITHVIRQLAKVKVISLDDFSAFKSLTFYFKDIPFQVQLHENQFGQLTMGIVDQKKPRKETDQFKAAFTKTFNIPFGVFLENENKTLDLISITRKLIANKTIKADMPEEIESIILDLIEKGFVLQPTENAKRRCIECHTIFWAKGDCRLCGNEAYFEGDYIDIEINEKNFFNYVYTTAKSIKGLTVKKISRKIDRSTFDFIDVINNEGDSLSIYCCRSSMPAKILDNFEENGNSLLVILFKYKEVILGEISKRNFECCDFSEIAQNDSDYLANLISSNIINQKNKWQSKITAKGEKSFEQITHKGANYDDQHFERDIYNILHEIFHIADRLGGKFSGIKAPDGIISIQDFGKPLKRYCFAWDCKYSRKERGYNLQDNPLKHIHYLNKLKENDKVVFFGRLQIYAFISQNMNEQKYLTFYKKLLGKNKWPGQILLVSESNILLLYQVYKRNEELIRNYPSIFYKKVFHLFLKTPSAERLPYKFVSNERISNTLSKIQGEFKKKHKRFHFQRNEFS